MDHDEGREDSDLRVAVSGRIRRRDAGAADGELYVGRRFPTSALALDEAMVIYAQCVAHGWLTAVT